MVVAALAMLVLTIGALLLVVFLGRDKNKGPIEPEKLDGARPKT